MLYVCLHTCLALAAATLATVLILMHGIADLLLYGTCHDTTESAVFSMMKHAAMLCGIAVKHLA